MRLLFLASFALAVTAVTGSDEPCWNQDGTCQDDQRYSCSGGYQSGLCSGGAHRRCCIGTIGTRLDCSDFGHVTHTARGTGYYPDSSPLEGGFVDMRGLRLHTLQQFLAGSANYVSVAMDNHAGIEYGTPLCIPELNNKYNKVILFRVVDTGSAFSGMGYSRIDICVQNQAASYDSTINGQLHLVFKH